MRSNASASFEREWNYMYRVHEGCPDILGFGIRLRYGMLRVDVAGGKPVMKTIVRLILQFGS